MTVHAGDSPGNLVTPRPRRPGNRAAGSKLLPSIVDSSDDAILSKTLDGVITTWNKAAERIYGYQAEEIIGRSISLLMPPDRRGEMVEILGRIRAGGRVDHYETTRRRKDGSTVPISLTVSPIHDAAGRIVGASSIARDITEWRRVHEQLRSAAEYARSLIEASQDPLVTISAAGKITDVNEATVRVTGVPREELVGTDFPDYFTEPELAREGYLQVFARGFVTDYPLTIRHTGGALTDVLCSASVYKDADGHVLGVFAAARDVTDSRRLLQELSEAKAFLDNILQSSTKYSIIGMDLDHRILSWNKGARRNYGYTPDEVIGKNASILHTAHDLESGAADRLLAAAYSDDLGEGTFERVRQDGSRFTASVVVTRRDDALGHPIGFLLMSEDISGKKLAEDRLRSASQYARSLIEASRDPLVTISAQGKITDGNEATIRVTGVSREELVGTDFSDYFTEPELAREGYLQVFARGFVTDYPLTIRHTDGALTDVLYNASVYKDAAGRVLGVVAAARDVTAQKRAESELAQQRARELDRLADLERFQKLTVGRELRMIELKKEIKGLRAAAGGS
ncbi:MAG: PAS domain S-box protein [Streptosporangiaceae bacterium]|jgi:PAS domain S-box-containing protein